jgi:hypothetical protein
MAGIFQVVIESAAKLIPVCCFKVIDVPQVTVLDFSGLTAEII